MDIAVKLEHNSDMSASLGLGHSRGAPNFLAGPLVGPLVRTLGPGPIPTAKKNNKSYSIDSILGDIVNKKADDSCSSISSASSLYTESKIATLDGLHHG